MIRRLPLLFFALVLPLLLVVTLGFASQIQAGVAYDICASSCTYSTIQMAVSQAPENTPLNIANETFVENVEITRSVILIGAGSTGPDLTIIDGQVTETVILIRNGVNVSISDVIIQNGDTTNFNGGGGLLNENGTVTLTNSIVQNNLALNGAGISNLGTMTLDNVTVRNNVADDLVGNISICTTGCSGGGIYNMGLMTLTNNSTIHGNSSRFGGGLENDGGTVNAANIVVYGNTAVNDAESAGGGIENQGTMTLTNSTVRDNNAILGGGVANFGALTVSGSDLYGNVTTSLGQGGGIHNSFDLTVQTSNIHDNTAGTGGGGGISSDGGEVVVGQTAVYNNSATGSGGGIVHNVTLGSGSFDISNSTLSGNSTQGFGGGLRNAGTASTSTSLNNVTFRNNQAVVVNGQSVSVLAGTVTAKNSIFAISQSGNNCGGTISSQGYNLSTDNTCNPNGTTDLTNSNPQLGPLQNNGGSTLTHALLPGSPAIDSGSGCPAVDQRGVTRGAACDRGAYEYDVALQSVYLPFVIRP